MNECEVKLTYAFQCFYDMSKNPNNNLNSIDSDKITCDLEESIIMIQNAIQVAQSIKRRMEKNNAKV